MKAAVEHVQQQYAFSQRRACGLLMVAVSSCRYQPRHSDEELRVRLVELAREKPRFGYRRLHVLLRRGGEVVNHKRVHRVYREAGLALRRKKPGMNEEWIKWFPSNPPAGRGAKLPVRNPGVRVSIASVAEA